MPRPPPNSGEPCPKRSWFTIMTSFATRTLCECQPSGIGTLASGFGCLGSATSKIDVPFGFFMWPTKSVLPSTHTCPPPATSMWPTSLVFFAFISDQLFGIAAGSAAVLAMQAERAQRRLVARDEEDHRLRFRFVDVLVPPIRRKSERVEVLPVEALAVDQRMPQAAAFERCDEKARGLLERARALARAQHLGE